MPGLLDRLLDRFYVACRDRPTDIETARGIVSFSFDDFPASALRNGAPVLEDAGWRGTYYTCGGLLGGASVCGTIASVRDIEDCLARGHEIANHTLSHCNCIEADAAGASRETQTQDIGGQSQSLGALPSPRRQVRSLEVPFSKHGGH
jgi:peptidoglycan/xylan/chitin deacetylase (PgdA/CDA1 family)